MRIGRVEMDKDWKGGEGGGLGGWRGRRIGRVEREEDWKGEEG